jgi:photosystem II stability/assembly factor-like uncharacterized protein
MRKFLLVACLLPALLVQAQRKKTPVATKVPNTDSLLFSTTQYRLVGPWRGGRSAAVAGSFSNRQVFFMGATGGGLWKTTDGGNNWTNISDKYNIANIGAIAIAPSDEQIMYVGEGENTLRGNVAEGLGGIWRTDDGGRTWKNLGLKDGRHIIRILVHPKNPDIVWAGVIGHLFGPNEERGVYKSTDGGKTWKRTLFVNTQTGVSDLVMDPTNPSILFAGTWRILRTPYSLESGGEGSGLWKSVDGGESWTNITASKGLPKGVWGIVGVAIAPSNPDKVVALIENEKGGLYTSSDAGKTWSLTSSDNNIRQRAWYYTKVFIDPKNEHVVYAPNVGFMRSRDGGKTFQEIRTPHSDHHDLWIDPNDPNRMIVADDGGGQVSYDGGNSWSSYMNQPTAQIYRVSTDNSFPYRILGAQQDNSTIRIKHRSYGSVISDRDWEETAGSESGYVVADPLNPDIVYGGNYGGYLSRLDHKTGENRAITVWPDNPMGAGADVLKYRFQWNFPIFFSPHNPKRLYCAGNALFVTENEGSSWEQISPDLTTNDKSKQGPSGGPITKDNTSVEYYCTIFTAAESSLEKELLWTGSDDGLVHVSKDGGKNWENVTPAAAPKWIMWNAIETHPTKKGVAYITGTRYKLDDFAPYIYKTSDYGKTWTLITKGIESLHFTRVMRADKKRDGLLYAGTEYGIYISYDDGLNWKKFQLNLPEVPITDLTIKDNDLIVATQGRAFWVLDDLTVVQSYDAAILSKPLHVFPVNESWRLRSGGGFRGATPVNAGKNPPAGVVIRYYVGAGTTDSTKASIAIWDKNKTLVKTFSTDSKTDKLEFNQGMNQWTWNLQYPEGEKIDGMILWNGVPGSILAAPGNYSATVKVGNDSVEVPFIVKADPNYKISTADYEAQFNFLREVQGSFNKVQKSIQEIRSLRTQLNDFVGRQGKGIPADVKQQSDTINKQLTAVEENLYQTKAKSFQDVLNFPIRLNDKLSGVFDAANSGNMAPSKQAKDVYADLAKQCDAEFKKLEQIKSVQIAAFNQLIREKTLPVIGVKPE